MNNIVAKFSSSMDANGNLKEYEVVEGSTFSDEYNETLDSATIILDHIKIGDRLTNLQPYEYVYVFDKSNESNFRRTYLVDNYTEQEKNIHEHIFAYTISLMSETKLLEKIQCPNLAITHDIAGGTSSKLKIWQHIERYIELYSPKIKYKNGTHWEYRKIITVPGSGSAFRDKFNVDCADISMSMPTLRQLLTSLMQQVGCIPTLRGGVLGFLDLRQTASSFAKSGNDFSADYTVSRIQRSLSSDSYANTLVSVANGVLDNNNTVIHEQLGFRCSSSAVLKQTSNLYLETRFPIYKVEHCDMWLNVGSNLKGYWTGNFSLELIDRTTLTSYGFFEYKSSTQVINPTVINSYINFDFSGCYRSPSGSVTIDGIVLIVTITYMKNDGTLGTYVTNHIPYDASSAPSFHNLQVQLSDLPGYSTGNPVWFNFLIDCISGVGIGGNHIIEGYELVSSDAGDVITFLTNGTSIHKFIYVPFDITKLVVENSQRQLLETNFKNMQSIDVNDYSTTDEAVTALSKYLYGTVGYSIGGKRIEGFSDQWSQAYAQVFGSVNYTRTYIENICNWIFALNREKAAAFLAQKIGMPFTVDYFSDGDALFPFVDDSNYVTYTQITFDLTYKPINSFNMTFEKQDRDIPFPIQQLNMNANAYTDFDRLVLHEQETVDRIGNEVLSISQRATNLSEIRGTDSDGNFSLVYFRDDKNRDGDYEDEGEYKEYLIFKRQIAVHNYYYDVSYTGMENAILKNYFTSIRTKYRAYENVDYSQSTLRHERDTFYVCLSSQSHFDGSHNIHFLANGGAWMFAGYSGSLGMIKNECEMGYGSNPDPAEIQEDSYLSAVKSEVSIISSENRIGFIYETYDNAAGGITIGSPNYYTYYSEDQYIAPDFITYMETLMIPGSITTDTRLGGVPQRWLMWRNSYALEHPVAFIGETESALVGPAFFVSSAANKEFLTRTSRLPIINTTVGGVNVLANTNKYFAIGENVDNTYSALTSYVRRFYKDKAETINHTIEFIYYTDDNEHIVWTNLFTESLLNRIKLDYLQRFVYVGETSNSAVLRNNSNWHNRPSDSEIFEGDGAGGAHIEMGNSDYIRVYWGDYNVITYVHYGQVSGQIRDIISFKKPANAGEYTDFYISFDDTKSNTVWIRDSSNGNILKKVGTIKKNNMNREIQ